MERASYQNLKLVVPENYAFTADNNFFIALGMPEKILKNINIKYSLVFSGSYKTQLVTTPPPKSLSLHCNQINKVKSELDGQPSSLLTSMQVSDYGTTFSPMHLAFLELDTHRHLLDFKMLDEENNEVILRTFYLQLLNKQCAYTTMKPKFLQIETLQYHRRNHNGWGLNCPNSAMIPSIKVFFNDVFIAYFFECTLNCPRYRSYTCFVYLFYILTS